MKLEIKKPEHDRVPYTSIEEDEFFILRRDGHDYFCQAQVNGRYTGMRDDGVMVSGDLVLRDVYVHRVHKITVEL